jgi:ubiquinone/menaquinone biosynthesis C-methylase UbiE
MDHIKRVTEEFGRQSETFEIWAEKTDDQVADRFRTALAKAGRGRVLDVACGPGVVTAAIASRAASVVAFDATEQMLEKARARCAKAGLRNVQFKCGDAENLPFKEAQFDGLITRLAVHHFADPQRAFDEMFRVLRPQGIAVIVDVVSSEAQMNQTCKTRSSACVTPPMYECCPHLNWMHALPGAVSASFSTLPGTSTANSRNGWESSTPLIVPNPSGRFFERWQMPAAPREWASRSKTVRSYSSIVGAY